MASETAHINTIKMNADGCEGVVKIADDVVAIIAGLAASDVKGVASLGGNVTRDVISRLGIKSVAKGVKLSVDEGGKANVSLSVNVRYGCNVPETCAKVQDKVKTAIETMTGLEVGEVNIRVSSIVVGKSKEASEKD